MSEKWEFPPFAAIYHYLLVLIFHILSMSFISVEVLIIFRHFPSKSALQTKSAWEAGSQDPTFSEGSQIYHLKCFYTSKMKRSLFSVLLHNDESYYWALLEPGRLHLPTSLSLRPWGWWQRPAGKVSWLTNFIFTRCSLSTRFSRSGELCDLEHDLLTFILNYRLPCKEIQWRSFHRLTEIPRNYLKVSLRGRSERRKQPKKTFKKVNFKKLDDPRDWSAMLDLLRKRCWLCASQAPGAPGNLAAGEILSREESTVTTDGQVWSSGRGQHGP